MISGRTDSEGRLYITTDSPDALSTFQGGIARTQLGQVHVTADTPLLFANGFGVTPIGEVCYDTGTNVDNWAMGLPFTSDGVLVCVLNDTPLDTDAYVGGIRVSPDGVHVTNSTPAGYSAWSPGFDGGFK